MAHQGRSEANVGTTGVTCAAGGTDGRRRRAGPQSRSRTRRQISSVKSEHFAFPPKSFVKLCEEKRAKIKGSHALEPSQAGFPERSGETRAELVRPRPPPPPEIKAPPGVTGPVSAHGTPGEARTRS